VIDHGDVRDFGGRPYKVSVRIVAASNKKRHELEKTLNSDFLNRLWCWTVEIPSLNSRREDVVPLATQFVQEAAEKAGRTITISPEALELLSTSDWSQGEVRQLRNTILNAAVRAGDEIGIEHVRVALESLSLNSEDSDTETSVPSPNQMEGWLGEVDLSKLERLCREIWASRGRNIKNNPDNVVGNLTFSPYYLRAVLVAFFLALKKDRKTFDDIFGFGSGRRKGSGLRQYLANQTNKYPQAFPCTPGYTEYRVTGLRADGEDLADAGFELRLT
jgi:DNA-binding NtrC family response regulator